MTTKQNRPAANRATGETQRGAAGVSAIHSTPIYVGRKVIGHVRGNVFHKSIRGSVHLLRKPPAIALDTQSLTDAESAGAEWAEILDTDSGKVYRARLSTVRNYGTVFNRGFGEQIYLCLSEWNQDAEAEQYALFAEGAV